MHGAAGVAAAGFLEDVARAGAGRQPRGDESGGDGGEQRGADGEGEHRAVDHEGDVGGQRVLEAVEDLAEIVHRPVGQPDADDGAEHGDEQALGEHLADEAGAGGAERGADGEFLGAQRGAGELHVHDVDAGDEQEADAEAQHGEEEAAEEIARERAQ